MCMVYKMYAYGIKTDVKCAKMYVIEKSVSLRTKEQNACN